MMMHLKRNSIQMAQVMGEIKQAAIKEDDDEWRSKLWRWYYKLLHGETEIQLIVKEREMLCLLEIGLAYGMLPENWKNEIAKLIANMEAGEDKQPPVVVDIDDDDIPPRQLGLWD
jgi:hypothetical protein